MPLDRYYKGHGEEVMADMKSRYGDEKGERVFYATANAKGMKPSGESPAPRKRRSWRTNASPGR